MRQLFNAPRLYSFLGACALLVLTFLVIGSLIKNRPLPKQKEEELLFRPLVEVVEVEKGTKAIRVQTYGTVDPVNSVTLAAPYSGRVQALSELYPGKYVKAGEILFSQEKTRIEVSLGQQHVQLKELKLQEDQLEIKHKLLKDRVDTTQRLLEIAQESVQKQEEQLANERQLYKNIEELYTKEAVSNNELLNQESKFLAMEVAYLEAKTREANVYNNLLLLKTEVTSTEFSIRSMENQRRLIELKIEELEKGLIKTDISVKFPAQISEVFVENIEEVSPGKQLATLRAVDSVEIAVNIPDAYFKWLYEGDLLKEAQKGPSEHELDIVLVNRGFRKRFGGGFIKSVADRVNVPTRSLPLVIGRENPKDEEGYPLPADELKPGMYCEVTILLHELENVFLIPQKALQTENHLFHIKLPEEEGGLPTLEIIKEVSVLHESSEGVIIRLPETYQHLRLVTQRLKRAWSGMEVELSKEKES